VSGREGDVVEHEDTTELQAPNGVDRAQLLRRVGLGAAALSVPALAGAQGAAAAGNGAANFGNFKPHPKWKFVFVNHVTTNPFFVPTQYGIQDACALLGCTYQWTGSAKSDVGEMVNSFNAAITSKASGIAVALIDLHAFNAPTKRALDAGIPVVSYNADAASGRLAYIGQDLFQSGVKMGERIVQMVPKGDVALFIATPGSLNIQPRIDGAMSAIKKSGKPIKATAIATGPDVNQELARIDAYYLGHKSVKGMFAVDAGSTQGVGQTIQKHSLAGKVAGGGYDLLPTTLQLIDSGDLAFTIDQQPYLQGFYPVEQLFLYKYSSGLVAPADTNTGLLFVTKANVKPYLSTKSRYEGSSSAQKFPVS
jgi:simple sugar transport system substrate-binding protein